MPTAQATTACFVLPPIRTFTVGPGISPGQPAAGCGRVADCNRRLGITPTPEHVPPSMHPPAEASHRASMVTPATARFSRGQRALGSVAVALGERTQLLDRG